MDALFFLLLRVLDGADQLFVMDILEGPSNRDEAFGVFIVDPVTSRTESLVRACRPRLPCPPPIEEDCPASWTGSRFLEFPLKFIGVVFILLIRFVSASAQP